jgi:hypothetical protein
MRVPEILAAAQHPRECKSEGNYAKSYFEVLFRLQLRVQTNDRLDKCLQTRWWTA